MKFAAIDIGTNSIRLLIAELKDNKLNKLVNRLETPRLGDGIKDGIISNKAINRSIKVLKEYKETIDKYNVRYRAVATSAIRDADNKQEFINRSKKEAKVTIDIIKGQEEAKLSYLGVINGVIHTSDNSLAVDIGGGSTEFIFGSNNSITQYSSINLGAVRLKEDYIDDLEAMKTEAKNKIEKKLNNKEINLLLGVGGTITTLAAIEQDLETYIPEKIHGYELNLKTINNIYNDLKQLSLTERKNVKGLRASRADIILPGIIILLAIINSSRIDKITVSDYSILEGIIYNNLNEGFRSSKS